MPYSDPVKKAEFMKRQAAKRRGATKICSRCKAELPEENFLKAKSLEKHRKRLRRSPYCHPCRAKMQKQYMLREMYGLTLDEFEAMAENQGGRCAICGGEPDYKRAYLCVDHDHATGKNRGLLCVRCNALIGNAQESADILAIATAYLANY